MLCALKKNMEGKDGSGQLIVLRLAFRYFPHLLNPLRKYRNLFRAVLTKDRSLDPSFRYGGGIYAQVRNKFQKFRSQVT